MGCSAPAWDRSGEMPDGSAFLIDTAVGIPHNKYGGWKREEIGIPGLLSILVLAGRRNVACSALWSSVTPFRGAYA